MATFRLMRGDAALAIHDSVGAGRPVVFQHGLGGDRAQVAEQFPDDRSVRRLTLECRGHGASTPGAARPFSIAGFADDVIAACDAAQVAKFVVGGISLGAAIALRIAVMHPKRVQGLILARPAWLFDAAPRNLRPVAEVARLLRLFPPREARAALSSSEMAKVMRQTAPVNLTSLLGYFDRPAPKLTADLLGDIAADGPGVGQWEATNIAVPTLVIGTADDMLHPYEHAKTLASIIPDASLVELPSQSRDMPGYIAGMRSTIAAFLADLP